MTRAVSCVAAPTVSEALEMLAEQRAKSPPLDAPVVLESTGPFDYPLVREGNESGWDAILREPYDARDKRCSPRLFEDDDSDFFALILAPRRAECPGCGDGERVVYFAHETVGDGCRRVYECLACGATEAW